MPSWQAFLVNGFFLTRKKMTVGIFLVSERHPSTCSRSTEEEDRSAIWQWLQVFLRVNVYYSRVGTRKDTLHFNLNAFSLVHDTYVTLLLYDLLKNIPVSAPRPWHISPWSKCLARWLSGNRQATERLLGTWQLPAASWWGGDKGARVKELKKEHIFSQ